MNYDRRPIGALSRRQVEPDSPRIIKLIIVIFIIYIFIKLFENDLLFSFR